MVRSPPAALHQPRTYTVTGTKARAWSTAAVVPLLLYRRSTAGVLLLLYCCIHAVLLYLRGCEAHQLLLISIKRSSWSFCVPMTYDSTHSADTCIQKHTHTKAPSAAVIKECCCC